MDKPLVTIITPCYNHEKYLGDYFKSIINQEYKNIELILIDDASKDNSQKIIENNLVYLKKRFVRVEYRPRKNNVGLPKNLNLGLALAKGKYIISFASDDVMLPNRVEENVNFLEDNSEYGMVYSNNYIFGGDASYEDLIKKNIKIKRKHKDKNQLKGELFSDLIIKNFITAGTVCVRKKCFDIIGNYNENLIYEDRDMWIRISKEFKIGYISKPLIFYRKHSNSLSSMSNAKKDLNLIKDQEKLMEKYSKEEILNEKDKKYMKYKNFNRYITYSMVHKDNRLMSNNFKKYIKFLINNKMFFIKNFKKSFKPIIKFMISKIPILRDKYIKKKYDI